MTRDRYHFTLDEAQARTGVKWTQYDPDVIPLWVADMDFPVADVITTTLAGFVADGDFGYSNPSEAEQARAAAAEWYRHRHGYEPDPGHAVVTRDVMQAVAAAIEIYTEPGDGVIVHTPIYPPFPKAVHSAGRRFLACPLTEGYEIDLDATERLAAEAGAILLSSPHNPTGRAFTKPELGALMAIADRHDLVVISDEIHADLVHPGHRHVPTATVAGSDRVVTIMAASKTFNIAGIGCGVMFFGSPALAKRFEEMPSSLVGHPRAVNVRTSTAAWQGGGRWLAETKAVLDQNRTTLAVWATRHGIGATEPEATYLSWLDFRGFGWEDEPHDVLLSRGRVALSPGLEFGPDPGFARLNFATSPEILAEALGRMEEALDNV